MSIIKLNNKAVSNATAIGSISSLGSMTFIKKLTASSSATLSFVDGTDGVVLDDTYKEYVFTFNNMHPATDAVAFQFQANTAGASGYNETITSTYFRTFHTEGDVSGLGYQTGLDQAQGTAFQTLIGNVGTDNDQSCVGTLTLFNPSSTTFVKHFISTMNYCGHDDGSANDFIAGYFNTTLAIDEIQFKMNSGNIDAGDICLYGIA
jgi:hypothetical protein